jgi:hypothetical protein
LAELDPAQILLVDFGLHPYLRQISGLKKFGVWSDDLAGRSIGGDDDSSKGGAKLCTGGGSETIFVEAKSPEFHH